VPTEWKPARRAQIDRDGRWTLKRGKKRLVGNGQKRAASEIVIPAFGYKNHFRSPPAARAAPRFVRWGVADSSGEGCVAGPRSAGAGTVNPGGAAHHGEGEFYWIAVPGRCERRRFERPNPSHLRGLINIKMIVINV
jgi:hypothetical protein